MCRAGTFGDTGTPWRGCVDCHNANLGEIGGWLVWWGGWAGIACTMRFTLCSQGDIHDASSQQSTIAPERYCYGRLYRRIQGWIEWHWANEACVS